MSGQITSNVFRASGVIAPTAGGLSWSSAIITGSTVTVEASNGYWINTTSNACTVTLPSSAEIGDQIVLADYARTWSTNNVIIDSNGLNFQGDPDTYTVDYSTAGQSLSIVYSDATKGWVPISDDAVAKDHTPPPTQKAIFGYGYAGGYVSMSNLVSSSGVIATDVSGVGTARRELAAAGYGVGLAIFGYGYTSTAVSLTNLVSYSGVVATDTSGVGTVRYAPAATRYGTDKAIFGYGSILSSPYYVSMTNLVSNVGVVATDVTGVGTTRTRGSATVYGSTGQAMFGYGQPAIAITNLITNVGVVGSDVSGVGTARWGLGGSPYGGDKAIFAYGSTGSDVSMSNLVNNVGVVASDVTGVGTARSALAAAGYSITA